MLEADHLWLQNHPHRGQRRKEMNRRSNQKLAVSSYRIDSAWVQEIPKKEVQYRRFI
jgi:hypothetical protein